MSHRLNQNFNQSNKGKRDSEKSKQSNINKSGVNFDDFGDFGGSNHKYDKQETY